MSFSAASVGVNKVGNLFSIMCTISPNRKYLDSTSKMFFNKCTFNCTDSSSSIAGVLRCPQYKLSPAAAFHIHPSLYHFNCSLVPCRTTFANPFLMSLLFWLKVIVPFLYVSSSLYRCVGQYQNNSALGFHVNCAIPQVLGWFVFAF